MSGLAVFISGVKASIHSGTNSLISDTEYNDVVIQGSKDLANAYMKGQSSFGVEFGNGVGRQTLHQAIWRMTHNDPYLTPKVFFESIDQIPTDAWSIEEASDALGALSTLANDDEFKNKLTVLQSRLSTISGSRSATQAQESTRLETVSRLQQSMMQNDTTASQPAITAGEAATGAWATAIQVQSQIYV